MKEYKEKLHTAFEKIAAEPVCLRTVEQATAVADLLLLLKKLEKTDTEAASCFDRAAAEEWAKHMENADGTTGAHWTMSQTDAVAESVGLPHDIPRWAFGVTMNMMYSDYYDVAMQFGVNRPDFYAALAKAFLMDKDAPAPVEKLCAYYEHIARAKRDV